MNLSIIIPSFNSADLLELTLSSFGERRCNTEIIVVDGNSDDHTNTVVNKYNDLIDLYISEADKGIYDAINKGIKLSKGNYYVVLGAGDFLYSHFLNSYKIYFNGCEDFVLFNVVSNKKVISANRGSIWRYGSSGIMSHHSVGTFIRRDIHDTLGPYSLHYKLLSDSDLILHGYKLGMNFKFFTIVSGCYLGDGVSSRNQIEASFELFLIQLKYESNFIIQLILFILRLIKFKYFH